MVIITVYFLTTGSLITDRNTVKAWLNDSDTYVHIEENMLNLIEIEDENGNKQTLQESLDIGGLDGDVIVAVISDSYNAEFLQSAFERVIDGTYDWLEGKTPQPEFEVSLL